MSVELLASLSPLFDCLTDGVCITDAGGRLLYANDAAGRLLGPAANEAAKTAICGHLCGAILDAACGQDAAACPLKFAHGPATAATFKGTHAPSGRDLRVRCLRAPLLGVERRFVIIEDDAAAARLRRQQEDWRQMLAHDMRSPLTIALCALRLIEDMGAGHTLTHEDIELLNNGAANCRRMETLIDAYLESERLVEGPVPVARGEVDVAGLIGELRDEHAAVAAARRLTVTGVAPLGLTARADPELLRRVLTNLLGNALKFAPQGGRIKIDASPRGSDILIRVADDGPGIPARDLPRIFDRFYQGSNAERRLGHGLGLTFSRAALRAMGGDISVESTEGWGSIFTLRLPSGALTGGAS